MKHHGMKAYERAEVDREYFNPTLVPNGYETG
jgi:hypothetical protein